MNYIVTLKTPAGDHDPLNFLFGPFSDFTTAFNYHDQIMASGRYPANCEVHVLVLNPPDIQQFCEPFHIPPAARVT